MTVRLYKIDTTNAYMMEEQGSGYSLYPAGLDTMYYTQEDDGGHDYELPDGYTVSECITTERYIYDPAGNPCTIILHTSGRPQLVSVFDSPVLRRVS